MTLPVTPAAPLAMASLAQTIDVFGAIATVLNGLGLHLARIVLAGDLNPEQQCHVAMAVTKIDGLEALFLAERARLAAVLACATKES